ncbi:CRISPR-associated helicase/endonuclease Cas3 [Paenibacillus peoriae]|uniref:CRISPR-associated helicase/endonuclease Cas3 n=1 Tax=Paenibacillus peoriae TaxID=59893 RepID=UPI00026C6222|nr:CRISPR-associated helicase/endonuclease Cas3 [Paenibacillus peoriae]MEC0183275.1 CRISPR-associated helicase/endonuclease Cas3 [Paenibacillus peoriae]
MDYIAHIRESDHEIQTVADHLMETQQLAETYGDKIGIQHITGLAGMLHDLGKYTEKFQNYIRLAVQSPDIPPKRGSVDHSTAGGKLLYNLFHIQPQGTVDKQDFMNKALLSEVVGNAIISHHAYLQDFLDPTLESKFLDRVRDRELEGFDHAVSLFYEQVMEESAFFRYVNQAGTELADYMEREDHPNIELKMMFLSKFVFSALIDADRTNTRCFEENNVKDEKNSNAPINGQQLFQTYYERLMERINDLQSGENADTTINLLRKQMSEQCEQFADKPSGILTLSIPTGGGKTLASLRYALKHAVTFEKKHIIYVVPFTTIIEQNAREVREIIRDDANILEHHSNVVMDEVEDIDAEGHELEDVVMNTHQKLKLAKDNWDSPIIFTTMVQFLNVFYAGGSRNVRRLHNLSESVIIFDEVQKVPTHCISLFNQALNFLKTYASSSIVLCTATQPELDFVHNKLDIEPDGEMVHDLDHVIEKFKRVEIVDKATDDTINTEKLADFVEQILADEPSVLVILNTKAVVKNLYHRLTEGNSAIPVYHLSTSMCPAHRNRILEEVKQLLEHKKPVVCISTQLIEAGVDISFDCVIRSLAGLDSIAQAAGRCNRHGRDGTKQVYVIDHEEEKLKDLKEIKIGKEITRKMFIDLKRDKTCYGGNILSGHALEIYFQKYYTELASDLNYYIPKLRKNMTELLSVSRNENTYYRSYYDEKDAFLPLFLANSYKTAAEHFQVIKDHTTAVIVPYGDGEKEGKEIIADLNGQQSIEDLSSLLRRAQQFTINITNTDKNQLSHNKGLVSFLDEKIWALTDGAYDDSYGLNVQNDSSHGGFIL